MNKLVIFFVAIISVNMVAQASGGEAPSETYDRLSRYYASYAERLTGQPVERLFPPRGGLCKFLSIDALDAFIMTKLDRNLGINWLLPKYKKRWGILCLGDFAECAEFKTHEKGNGIIMPVKDDAPDVMDDVVTWLGDGHRLMLCSNTELLQGYGYELDLLRRNWLPMPPDKCLRIREKVQRDGTEYVIFYKRDRKLLMSADEIQLIKALATKFCGVDFASDAVVGGYIVSGMADSEEGWQDGDLFLAIETKYLNCMQDFFQFSPILSKL